MLSMFLLNATLIFSLLLLLVVVVADNTYAKELRGDEELASEGMKGELLTFSDGTLFQPNSQPSSTSNCDSNIPGACDESRAWTYETQIELLPFDLDLFGEEEEGGGNVDAALDHTTLKQLTENYLLDAFRKYSATSLTIHRIELTEKKDSTSIGNFEGVAFFRGVENIPTLEQVEDAQIGALENPEPLNDVFSNYLSEL